MPPPPDLELDLSSLEPNEVVAEAIRFALDRGASDVFFSSNENDVTIAMRMLGIYRLISHLPVDLGRRCQGHIKAEVGLDYAEHRRPQDGRWTLKLDNGVSVDMRINILPTLFGEDITLRLLLRKTELLSLPNLGFLHKDLNKYEELLRSPSGLILVTGPTGSGKTTTLYASLNTLNNGHRKINTIEDPIEYALAGIRQSQVNPHIDLDFAEILRSVLRQAPDVIMVGEVRDPITADTAVRAANSGHIVLATLHAPTAAAAVQSMLSLGVLPNFLASSLRGVVAQRLVRTLCPKCKSTQPGGYEPIDLAEETSWLSAEESAAQRYYAIGCPECHYTGYAGRSAACELLVASPAIRKLIVDRRPTADINAKAIEEGMVEMRFAARYKIASGLTTPEEAIRVIPSEYLTFET